VYVVIALAALAILAGVVVLAMGKGGELSEPHPDYPPPLLPTDRRLVGMDAALLKLPRGLWGYQVDCADEALRMFAHALSERDRRVADLEQQVAELRRTASVPDRTLPEVSWLTPPGAPAETTGPPAGFAHPDPHSPLAGEHPPAEQTAIDLRQPETPEPPTISEISGPESPAEPAEHEEPAEPEDHGEPEKPAEHGEAEHAREAEAAEAETAEAGAEETPSWALPQPPEPWWQSESVTRIHSEDEGGKS
jgi:hypothetical protein